MGKKNQRREQDYKKQQAYQVALEKKLRGMGVQEKDLPELPPEREITDREWDLLKGEVAS